MACLLAEYAVRPGLPIIPPMTKLTLHAVPRSTEIDVDEAVKDLIVSLRHGRCGAIDTGVIESSIEPAVSLNGKIDHDRDLSLVRNVAHYGEDVVTFPT